MKNAIETAKARIRTFCRVNRIFLNEEILEVPVYGIKSFFEGREQSEDHITEADIVKAIGDSEAYYLEVDEMTGAPAIVYDERKMDELDFEDKVQIIIHEFLHYYEAVDTNLLLAYLKTREEREQDDKENEAETEAISFLINLYYLYRVEMGLTFLATMNLEKIKADYKDGLGEIIARKIKKELTKEVVRSYLE